jgi:TolB-like protein/Flp pilus assembly protein TadD
LPRRQQQPKQTSSPLVIKSIAVLPFKPLVSDKRDEPLEMGMADTLIARLSNIREIDVRPISAVRRYAALEQDALAAGREQRVDAVLDGSIQKSGDRIRITVRLVGVENGATLWTDTFDDNLNDIFTVEDSISERVAGVLVVKLTGEERVLVAQHSTNNAEAYQLYLKGRYFWNKRTGEALRKGIDYFNQAIDKDRNYALAYAGLAQAYASLSSYSESTPQEGYSRAREAAAEALKIDDKLAEAHAALASVMSGYDWEFAGAEREYKRAIELNPNLATAHAGYGEYLGMMGRLTEAIAELRRAQEIEPLSLSINTGLGSVLYFAGQFDESIDQLRKTLDLDSSSVRGHIELGYAYRQKRQYENAISEFKKALDLGGEDTYALSQLAHTYAILGQRDPAYRAIEQLKRQSKQRYVLPSDIAAVYAGLGEKDRAFEWLEKGYGERDANMPYLKVDPSWDSLRSDQRFRDLLRRVGFPQQVAGQRGSRG